MARVVGIARACGAGLARGACHHVGRAACPTIAAGAPTQPVLAVQSRSYCKKSDYDDLLAFVEKNDTGDAGNDSVDYGRPYDGGGAVGGGGYSSQPYQSGGQSRGGDVRPGDWACPACGVNCFASRQECFRCSEPRPEGGGAPAEYGNGGGGGGRSFSNTHQARPGDWTCPNSACSASCFGSRAECFKCGEPRPEGMGTPAREKRDTDWTCPNPSCAANCFGNRTECFKCGEARPEGMGSPVYQRNDGYERRAPEVRPGDWTCPNPSCGANVFASKSACFRCNEPKPDSAY